MLTFHSSLAFRLTIATICGFVLLMKYFPVVAAFVGFFAIGIGILVTAYKSYKRGYIGINLKYRLVSYDRRTSPAAFWFYMCVAVLAGIYVSALAMLMLVHKFPGQ
jgi:hypothetical protein